MSWPFPPRVLIPAIHGAAVLAGALWMVLAPLGWGTVGGGLLALAAAYLLPPLAHRLSQRVAPLKPGRATLTDPGAEPWLRSFYWQFLYMHFPAFEAALRMVPGLYSAWLRLWGSRIGRTVFWAPGVMVGDRSLLVVGDGTVFGYGATVMGHLVTRKGGREVVIVAPVIIGADCLVGAHASLAPGTRLGDHVEIGYGAALAPLVRVGDDARVGGRSVLLSGARVPAHGEVPNATIHGPARPPARPS